MQLNTHSFALLYIKYSLLAILTCLQSLSAFSFQEHAFRMSNYPLIISIDNYCSKSQQAKMVAIFQEEFRDELGQSMLASENIMETFGKEESEYRLPSPLQLQGKILLKASCKQKVYCLYCLSVCLSVCLFGCE